MNNAVCTKKDEVQAMRKEYLSSLEHLEGKQVKGLISKVEYLQQSLIVANGYLDYMLYVSGIPQSATS